MVENDMKNAACARLGACLKEYRTADDENVSQIVFQPVPDLFQRLCMVVAGSKFGSAGIDYPAQGHRIPAG